MIRLAIGYAPAACQSALSTLFLLDRQLERMALQPGDPALAAIRLQFWIDAIADQRADGIPLLEEIAEHWPNATLAPIAEAWGDQLEHTGDADAAIAIARRRGAGLFDRATEALGVVSDTAVRDAGAGWALTRLGLAPRIARDLFDRSLDRRWPRRMLPLRLITRLALHALDHPGEAPGSRRRIALLWWWATTNR